MATESQASATQAVPQTEDAKTLQLLVQLLLAERQEAMQDRKAQSEARLERDKQRRINADYNVAEKRQSQALCSHKKGGKGLRGPRVDYAISFHTFVSAESYIRCLICGMKWKNTDTAEFITRRGKKIENHTGIGWKEAYKMLSESTNTRSRNLTQEGYLARQIMFSDSDAIPRHFYRRQL
jgi:hypothetical protein